MAITRISPTWSVISEGKGRLEVFHDAYRAQTGTNWTDERDAYAFNRDEVIKALAHTLRQSEQSCEKWD